jgi:hypothetical protein
MQRLKMALRQLCSFILVKREKDKDIRAESSYKISMLNPLSLSGVSSLFFFLDRSDSVS